MPNYDYKCPCGHKFIRFESMTKSKYLCLCPKCKKKKAVRQISAGGGIHFKGTGFYITDYKKSTPIS